MEREVSPWPEYEALYNTCRRLGFRDADLVDVITPIRLQIERLSLLIACRDRGHFPKMLCKRSVAELRAIVRPTDAGTKE